MLLKLDKKSLIYLTIVILEAFLAIGLVWYFSQIPEIEKISMFEKPEGEKIIEQQLDELEQLRKETPLLQRAESTLIVKVDNVAISFFYYPYPLVYPKIKIEDVYLASKKDIAAMKIIAISDRGARRDFVDIYFLLKEFSLENIFDFVKQKYPEFNIYVGLRGLTYFIDADKKQRRKLYLFNFVSWSQIKKF